MTSDSPIKELKRVLEPFTYRSTEVDEIKVDGHARVGYTVALHIVCRDPNDNPINVETGDPCAPDDTWEIIHEARLGKRRYHYLKRKGREQQLHDELAAEIALAFQGIAKRVLGIREVAEKYGWKIIPIPQEVQPGSTDAL